MAPPKFLKRRTADVKRLWAAAGLADAGHGIDPGELGQYAGVLRQHGGQIAADDFPSIAAHLQTGCKTCDSDLQAHLEYPDETEPVLPPQPADASVDDARRRVPDFHREAERGTLDEAFAVRSALDRARRELDLPLIGANDELDLASRQRRRIQQVNAVEKGLIREQMHIDGLRIAQLRRQVAAVASQNSGPRRHLDQAEADLQRAESAVRQAQSAVQQARDQLEQARAEYEASRIAERDGRARLDAEISRLEQGAAHLRDQLRMLGDDATHPSS